VFNIRSLHVSAFVAGLALAASATVSAQTTTVTGAGSTFAQPLYQKWAAEYNRVTGVKLNYQGVGSGAGIKQVEAKTVDFGASDMPLSDKDLQANNLVQFPTVVGGVALAVNLPGVKPGELKLDGQVLGDIYLGKITKWNDPAIKALNPAVKLPDAIIIPVNRTDGSGTTFLFTNYLSKVNAQWKSQVGFDTAVKWPSPNGLGGKGTAGVAAQVQNLPNAIGYVEYAYVKQNNMTYTLMRNAAGDFVTPDMDTFKAAAAGADWNKTFNQVLTNQQGKNAWPITGATFILMQKAQDKPDQAAGVLKFFNWGYGSAGDKIAEGADLVFVPMPDAVKGVIRKSWGQIKDASGKAIAY
jgi:phosphate transport system substrate-binding protein